MQARNIKVGQQYMASLDSSSERTRVTVVDKYRVKKQTWSGRGGYPSLYETTRTAFNVRDDAGQISKSVAARDLFELPKPAFTPGTMVELEGKPGVYKVLSTDDFGVCTLETEDCMLTHSDQCWLKAAPTVEFVKHDAAQLRIIQQLQASVRCPYNRTFCRVGHFCDACTSS